MPQSRQRSRHRLNIAISDGFVIPFARRFGFFTQAAIRTYMFSSIFSFMPRHIRAYAHPHADDLQMNLYDFSFNNNMMMPLLAWRDNTCDPRVCSVKKLERFRMIKVHSKISAIPRNSLILDPTADEILEVPPVAEDIVRQNIVDGLIELVQVGTEADAEI